MFRYLPEQASANAHKVDWLNNLITDISVFFTVAICATMIYFAIKYRKRNGKDHSTPNIEGSHILEIIWTVVPTLICIYVAYYGIVYYKDIREVPTDAMTIRATGQKWDWYFEYEDSGKKTKGEIVVPVDRPVKIALTSKDVLHSFFVPAMRVKKDAIPGQNTYVSFTPIKTGTYRSYCTEYCGDKHYNMLATLKVVSEAEYQAWLQTEEKQWGTPAELGQNLYYEKGCNACHSLNGTRVVGPTFEKLYGKEGELDDGTKYKADEEYITNSIYEPSSQVVKGYQKGLMPVYKEQINEDEIFALIAFIKTLDGTQVIEAEEPEEEEVDLSALSPSERGEKLYTKKLCNTCHSLDGSRLVGPTFKGIYEKEGELEDGSKYIADEEYLKESIVNPNAKIVKDYPAAMLVQEFSDQEIVDLIAYLKTLK